MRKTIILAAVVALSSCEYASASSDGTWSGLYAKANDACIGRSGIHIPEASAPVLFGDAGRIAMLLRGPVGSGMAQTNIGLICLYDINTGRASIAAYRWLGR